MSGKSTPKDGTRTVYFDAELRPHQSLGPMGFAIVMTAAIALGIGIGIAFMLAGAWPVLGFCGVELALLYVAFRLNYRSLRRYERIRLTDDGLEVSRYDPKGEVRRWEIEPNWLRVDFEDGSRGGNVLTLSSHGRSIAVGGFLAPAERAALAAALRAAIERYRIADPAD